jgi:site-specific DNA recombinase
VTQVALHGVYNSMFMINNRAQVRRGMEGVVTEGRYPGGRPYGYSVVPGEPGVLVINEAEAEIVRRIFDSYIKGKTPREIAQELNEENVPPPRKGQMWWASTINGNGQRLSGILQNPLYSGVMIWNRVKMAKNPRTGRRVSRINQRPEWIKKEVPGLRIVQQDMFEAAQKRKAERGGLKPHQKRKPRHLFSGLLRCGCCGSGMSVKDKDHDKIRVVCKRLRKPEPAQTSAPITSTR